MFRRVAIHGKGIAACCCARLLSKAGFEVSLVPGQSAAAAPTLLINRSTQKLLSDVFDCGDLFSGLPIVGQRVVRWGAAPEEAVLPHTGIVINESALLEKLWAAVAESGPTFSTPDWAIYSTANRTQGEQQRFGMRLAATVPVQLKDLGAQACWVESLDSGWLFLLPAGNGSGSLLAVGGSPAELLSGSRLILAQVDEVTGPVSSFPASPRILDPLYGPEWLACGSAALGFDPVCGEGAGNAVREAILATAVLKAVVEGEHPANVLAHYSTRLSLGFVRHLDLCRQFYASASAGEWWLRELSELDRGIEWMRSRLSSSPPDRYRLVEFDLARIS